MPYHLVAYKDIPGIPTSLISSYRATVLDTTKDAYLSQKTSTTIPPLLNSLLTSLCVRIEALSNQGRSMNGMRSPVH